MYSLSDLLLRSIVCIAIISGIPLLLSTLAGLLVAVVQTATSIQEQSISFLVKIIVVCAVLTLGMQWISDSLMSLTQDAFSLFPIIGGGSLL